MQKLEKKRVAGGASWKLLKTKGQICSEYGKKAESRRQKKRCLANAPTVGM